MRERWPWLAVLTAVLLTGFFLPDLSLAIQDRRAEGRTESRAADSPVLVHKEEDIDFALDDMEIVRDRPDQIELAQGRELDYDAAISAALLFLEGMVAHDLIPDRMERDVEVSLEPRILYTGDARTAVVWYVRFVHDENRVSLFMDDREGRLLAFTTGNYMPDTVDAAPGAAVLLDRMLRFCQESCAPLTCERAVRQDISIEDDSGESLLRTAFQLSDGTGRSLDVDVYINQRNDYFVCSFNM